MVVGGGGGGGYQGSEGGWGWGWCGSVGIQQRRASQARYKYLTTASGGKQCKPVLSTCYKTTLISQSIQHTELNPILRVCDSLGPLRSGDGDAGQHCARLDTAGFQQRHQGSRVRHPTVDRHCCLFLQLHGRQVHQYGRCQ